MNKSLLIQSILSKLREELQIVDAATKMANEEVLPSDDVTESQREPRALETSYFVDSQQKHAAELKEAIVTYQNLEMHAFAPGEPVAGTAVVELVHEDSDESTCYFLGPRAGGLEVSWEGRTVFVLSPQSPLARRLMGRNRGDVVAVNPGTPGQTARIAAIW